MSGKRVIELRVGAIYHAENPFGRQSAERLVRSGELVLSEVDFSVEEGEFGYRIGRVGGGKGTLLKTLYADVQLLVGEGCVVGFDLRKLRRRQIPYLRRKIGIVFQDYQLLTDRNVFQNLYYVLMWQTDDRLCMPADLSLLFTVSIRAVCLFHIRLSVFDPDPVIKIAILYFDGLILRQGIRSIDFPIQRNPDLISFFPSRQLHHKQHRKRNHNNSCSKYQIFLLHLLYTQPEQKNQ